MDNDVRARIGLIIPNGNVLTERQFRLYAPADIQAHIMRLRLTRQYHQPPLEALPRILEAAEQSGADALVPSGPSGVPEPLCAVYHRRSLGGLEAAFGAGERKVTVALARVRTTMLPFAELSLFQNVNTPEDWAVYGGQ